ncbi:MAG: EamA/RhaT family transporter [Thermoprotei archaeon]|nr:MAG: EamA/RhaT family transporter [Thermoprotei archaeon]
MKSKFVGQAILILLTFIWGTTFPVMKIIVENIGFAYYVFLRFSIASIILAPYIFLRYKAKILFKDMFPGIVLGILFLGGISFQGLGIEYTSASNAAFITGLSVVFVYLIEVAIGGEKVSIQLLLAIILSIIGLYLLSFKDMFTPCIGDLIVLIGSFFWAFQIISVGRYSKKFDLSRLLFFEISSTALGSILLLSFIKMPSLNNILDMIPYILYLSIFCTIFTNMLQLYGQKLVSNVEAAIIYLMEPVFAYMLSFIMLGEQLSIRQFFGAFFIMLAMILSSYKD